MRPATHGGRRSAWLHRASPARGSSRAARGRTCALGAPRREVQTLVASAPLLFSQGGGLGRPNPRSAQVGARTPRPARSLVARGAGLAPSLSHFGGRGLPLSLSSLLSGAVRPSPVGAQAHGASRCRRRSADQRKSCRLGWAIAIGFGHVLSANELECRGRGGGGFVQSRAMKSCSDGSGRRRRTTACRRPSWVLERNRSRTDTPCRRVDVVTIVAYRQECAGRLAPSMPAVGLCGNEASLCGSRVRSGAVP